MKTRKFHVEVLLHNFVDYVNPEGEHDPWFTLAEINQQFVWEDIPDEQLEDWLAEMVDEGKVITEVREEGRVFRWLS